MEHIGSEYLVILSDPLLRAGLIRDAERSRQSRHGASAIHTVRRWFARALHTVAACINPASRTVDLQPAPASTVR